MIKHKKVELTELFYDLVYVYGFSQTTSLIHHVHQGVIPMMSFFSFAIGMLIMLNSWMVQTVFTNRFGRNSLTNIAMMFGQMVFLLIALTSITGDVDAERFLYFYGPFSAISFLLLVQYILEYRQTENLADKLFIRRFFSILGARTTGLMLALFLPYQIGLVVAAASVLITWLLPGFLVKRKYMSSDLKPMNFPHLVERLSLLVIITFGEMLIGIADYFSPNRLGLLSFFIFLIVASLFMIYIVEIDHLIDPNTLNPQENQFIYWHYPIIFGLSFVTVAIGFLGNAEAHNGFAVALFYLGIFLMLTGIYQFKSMNKPSHQFTKQLVTSCLVIWLSGLLLSCFFLTNAALLIGIGATVTVLIAILAVRFNLKTITQH